MGKKLPLVKKKSSEAERENQWKKMQKTCREKEAQIFRMKKEVAGRQRQRKMCRNRKKTREEQTDNSLS